MGRRFLYLNLVSLLVAMTPHGVDHLGKQLQCDVTATWRCVGKVSSQNDQVPVEGIGNVFKAENYIDLFAAWNVNYMLTLNAGINNALGNGSADL